MADDNQNAGTTDAQEQAQQPNQAAGTAPAADEVTTLRSRNAGLDAKVTELIKAAAAAEEARKAAEARLADYEAGKAGEAEASRALIERLNAELAETRRTAQVNALKATYPESFSVYGDAIAGMSEDVLAAGEARLRGVPVESNTPPVPVGNNAARSQSAVKTVDQMSRDELREYGKSAFAGLTWEAISQGD